MGRKTIYNKTTHPQLMQQINDKNMKLIDEFVDYLHSIDRSDGTINGYVSDLNMFFVWNLQYNENKFFVDLKKKDILKFQGYMINTLKQSPKRVSRMKASLSSLSNYIFKMLDEEYPNFRNIINIIECPKAELVREKTVLSNEDVEYLLNNLVENNLIQEACTLALAISSGARKAELTRIKVSDFDDSHIIYGCAWETNSIKTKGRGKNGKQLKKIVFMSSFKKYLDLWLKERERLNIKCEYLLVSKDSDGNYDQMTISALNYMAERFTKILNKSVFYFHACRHFLCSLLAESNIPATEIQNIFGWQNLEMVNIYNDNANQVNLSKYFTENGIKKIETANISQL